MALSHKDWQLPYSQFWLAEIDIISLSGLDFLISGKSSVCTHESWSRCSHTKHLLGQYEFIIIWQGSLERNPSVLIGSFLVRISPYGPFPCTKPYSFCFRKPANSKQAWAECHIMNYLLSQLAQTVLGNIGPLSFFSFCTETRFVLPLPRVNIPQYGPRARLVKG